MRESPPRPNAAWPNLEAFLTAGPWLMLMLGCALAAPAAAQPTDADPPRAAFTGRLHWDAGTYRQARDPGAGGGARQTRTLLRRARLGVEGAAGRFAYLGVLEADTDAIDRTHALEIEEIAIYYSPSDRVRIGVGKMKIPVTFDESTSSNDIGFIERSLPVDLFTDETLGPKVTNAQVWFYGSNHLVEAAMHLARDSGGAPDVDTRAKKVGFTGRAAFAPVRTDTTAVHLGGWVDRSGGPVGDALWGYGPELDVAGLLTLSGRRPVGRFEALVHRGLEAAWLHGPFSLQAEIVGGRFHRLDSPDYAAGGWYAQVGYVAGGAKRYDMREGAWSAPAVTQAITDGGTGVVEFVLRYSTVDFGEPVNPTGTRPAGDTGHTGRQSNVSAGINWYLTGHSRVMFNAILVDLDGAFGRYRDPEAAGGIPVSYARSVTGSFRIYGVRWQYHW